MKQFLRGGDTLIILSEGSKKVIVSGIFSESELKEVESMVDSFLNKPYSGYTKSKVKINGVEYKSIAEASRKTGVIFNTIKRRIKVGFKGYEML